MQTTASWAICLCSHLTTFHCARINECPALGPPWYGLRHPALREGCSAIPHAATYTPTQELWEHYFPFSDGLLSHKKGNRRKETRSHGHA